MASGTIRGAFSGVHWAYPEIVWSSSSNVASNSSSVTAILYFVRTANYNSYNLDGHTVTMNVNGSASASRSFNLNTSRVEVWRRTVSVNHHPDGTQSITIGASSSGTGTSLGSYNFSGTAVLDKIPRAYSFTVSTTTVEMDDTCTVKVNSNGSGLEPWLYLNFGGKRVNYGRIPVGTDFVFTPSVADFASKIPNATSGWGMIEVETWSGNTFIGRYQISPFTLTLPSSVKPTLESLTSSDVNDAVTNAIGSMSNTYIQGLSSIRFSANNAKGVHGSAIQKFTFSIGDWSVNHAGYQRDMNLKDKPTLTGTQTAKVVVTDSRGRTASKTLSINILPYSNPTLNITADRTAADQTKVLITPTGKVSSIKNGTAEKNTYTIKMEYKLSTATTWTEVPNGIITSFKAVTLANVAKDKSYSLQVTLSDKFYTVVATQNISTTKVLFDLFKDEGIGVGKMRERGSLDIAGDVYIDNRKLIDIFYPVGAIFQSTNSANPSTFMGGTWERYGKGKVLVSLDEADADFATVGKTGGEKEHTLTIEEMPSHNHQQEGNGGGDKAMGFMTPIMRDNHGGNTYVNNRTKSTGGGGAHNNLQPYQVVYTWRRTA